MVRWLSFGGNDFRLERRSMNEENTGKENDGPESHPIEMPSDSFTWWSCGAVEMVLQ
jgi:hypothetical protein